MSTNLNINQQLLQEAQRIGNKKTKRETVDEALQEYIQRRKQKEILKVFGKIDLNANYDYKKERRER